MQELHGLKSKEEGFVNEADNINGAPYMTSQASFFSTSPDTPPVKAPSDDYSVLGDLREEQPSVEEVQSQVPIPEITVMIEEQKQATAISQSHMTMKQRRIKIALRTLGP